MAVHVGITCERCRTIHFILTSTGIKATPAPGMFVLSCRFCKETREFRKETMRPYRVQDQVFRTGFAKEGEYDAIPVPTDKSNKPPQSP